MFYLIKKTRLIFLLFICIIPFQLLGADNPPSERAIGMFVVFGVGPRFPVSDFARSTFLGYGFNIELDYTDDNYLPLFLYAKLGYEHYPGSQEFYQTTDYSHFSTTIIPANLGVRYYFPPAVEEFLLIIPFLEASGTFAFSHEVHEFKIGTGRTNFIDDKTQFGFSAGVGVSMFLVEILTSYNWLLSNQFLSIDLKARIPLFISI